MIKLALFDFNGVTVTGGYEATSAWLAEQKGWGRSRWRDVYAILYKQWFEQAQREEIPEPAHWAGALKDLGLDLSIDRVRDFHFATHQLRKGIVPIIRSLQRHGVHCVLLTKNLREYVPRYVRQFNLDQLFNAVVNTQEFGLRKGDPAVMRRVAKQFAVTFDQMVFVDDQAVNLEGAETVGAHPILYQSLKQLRLELNRLGALGAKS